MTQSVSVRLDERLIEAVDRAREREGRDRSEIVREALELWLRQRTLTENVRRHEEGYRRQPVADDEVEAILGAQRWPK